MTEPPVTLDQDVAAETQAGKYLRHNRKASERRPAASYVALDGTEAYLSQELNMLNKRIKDHLQPQKQILAEDDILYSTDKEVRQKMYDDTLSFFAKLYGEDTQETQPAEAAEDTAEAQAASEDTSYDATAEDGSYTEEYAE